MTHNSSITILRPLYPGWMCGLKLQGPLYVYRVTFPTHPPLLRPDHVPWLGGHTIYRRGSSSPPGLWPRCPLPHVRVSRTASQICKTQTGYFVNELGNRSKMDRRGSFYRIGFDRRFTFQRSNRKETLHFVVMHGLNQHFVRHIFHLNSYMYIGA